MCHITNTLLFCEIADCFTRNFDELFKSETPSIPMDLGGMGERMVTVEDNEKLINIPAETEIKAAI